MKQIWFLKIGVTDKFKKAPTKIARTLLTKDSCGGGVLEVEEIKCEQVGQITDSGFTEMTGRVYSQQGLSPSIRTFAGGNTEIKVMEEPKIMEIKVNSANSKGYEVATENDSINLSFPGSKTRRGRVGKGVAQTLDCNCEQGVVEPIAYDEQNQMLRTDGTVGTLTTDGSSPKHNNRIIEPNLKTKMCNDLIEKGLVKDGDVIRHSYTNSRMNGEMKDIKENNMCPTLDTRADCLGVCVKQSYELSPQMKRYIVASDNKYKVSENNLKLNRDIACAKTTREGRTRADASDYISPDREDNCQLKMGENLMPYRIRKLTPKECFRLMGVKDEDYEKVAVNQSNSSLYHLAGDSICVPVLMAIFSQMLNIDWEKCLWDIKKSI